MNIKPYLLLLLAVALLQSCNRAAAPANVNANPAAPGFLEGDSDARAIAIADEVMEASGGRRAWDETRYILWNFFGNRQLAWDKKTGDVRIRIPKEELTILVNIHDNTGQVKLKGAVQNHPDSLSKYLERGRNIWINDSYWLVMPFKLKDTGVALKYQGEGQTQDGRAADVLQLTFKEVGTTPQNKYLVYVDKDSRLVTQWDFYSNATDPEPRFSTSWANYQPHGKIKLSSDRGQRQITGIAVLDTLPPAVFNSLEDINWEKIVNPTK